MDASRLIWTEAIPWAGAHVTMAKYGSLGCGPKWGGETNIRFKIFMSIEENSIFEMLVAFLMWFYRMKKIFIMEILCIYAKRRFFARYFEMYCHFIISGENEREECEVVEEEGERQKRERRKTFNQWEANSELTKQVKWKGKPKEGLAPRPQLISPECPTRDPKCQSWHMPPYLRWGLCRVRCCGAVFRELPLFSCRRPIGFCSSLACCGLCWNCLCRTYVGSVGNVD